MPICNNCQVEFPTKSGSYNKFCSLKCANTDLAYKSREKSKEKYYINPMLCHFCGGEISYEASRWKRRDLNRAKRENRIVNIFCSRSCAASYNNIKSKRDICSLSKTPPRPQLPKIKKPTKIFSKINYTRPCIVCNTVFTPKNNCKTVVHCSSQCKSVTLSRKGKERLKLHPSVKLNRDPTRQSYMEKSFEMWIQKHGLSYGLHGYLTEVHIYNKHTKNMDFWILFFQENIW